MKLNFSEEYKRLLKNNTTGLRYNKNLLLPAK